MASGHLRTEGRARRLDPRPSPAAGACANVCPDSAPSAPATHVESAQRGGLDLFTGKRHEHRNCRTLRRGVGSQERSSHALRRTPKTGTPWRPGAAAGQATSPGWPWPRRWPALRLSLLPCFQAPQLNGTPSTRLKKQPGLRPKRGASSPPDGGSSRTGELQSLGPLAVDRRFHRRTHLGRTALESTLGWYFYVPRLPSISRAVCEWCQVCARNTPRQGLCAPPGVQSVGGTPSEEPEVDR